ncbi:unnamed protein product [Knipowitschia caucasica]|uniref:Uncharacterized protein n=1 Tax=Knipowitschia caucasica TaxID=637954 RepID=A0AAV2J4L3_KNICA
MEMKLLLLLVCIPGSVKSGLEVESSSGGVKIKCASHQILYKGEFLLADNMVQYQDSNTGEYVCKNSTEEQKIFVKFRTCENCVELDVMSAAGLIVGDVLATVVIGVSIFLIAKHSQTTSPNKKGSDKQRLVPNEATSDPYQRLRFRNGQREIYDELAR